MATSGMEELGDNERQESSQDHKGIIASLMAQSQHSLLGMQHICHKRVRKVGDVENPRVEAAHLNEDCDAGALVVFDEMTYKPESLLNWTSMLTASQTIWSSRHLWGALGKLAQVTLIVTILIVLSVPDPASLRIDIFYELSKFLNIFVGLMLGFFLQSAVTRWHHCAQGFLELCDAIRNLQMQLLALGAPQQRTEWCIRYGILSGWLLMNHLEVEMNNPGGEIPDEIWRDVSAASDDAVLGNSPHLLPCEVPILKRVKDPAGAMWTWISSLLGRMAQDGEIPGMPTPTYGRIMNIAQDAHNGIRHVRSAISVRTPYVYVQMLASLVLMNNIMNAINLGIVLGIAVSGFLIRHGLHYFKQHVTGNEVERDVQFFFVTAIICAMGPILYQALIEISVCLAQPFATKFGRIPIGRLLLCLEEDLKDGKNSTQGIFKWARACFKHQEPGKK